MADEPNVPDQTADEQPLSLSEHEAQFGGEAPRITGIDVAEGESRTQTTAGGSGTPGRDDKGRFQPRTPRERRPASHQASPEDVPRIKELTAKLREAEARATRLESAGPATQIPPESHRRAPESAAAPVTAAPTTARAKPTPADKDDKGQPKYATYEDYLDDRDAWNREQWSAHEAQERTAREQATQLQTSWRTRTDAAKTKYDDFEQVALMAPTKIPQGSLIDAWILDHDAGADVLYHLQKNPAEVERLLALPLLKQVDQLSLLSQRLSGSSTRPQAAPTGAAARVPVVAPPRPPTPVRTGPTRAGDEPPEGDHSIAEHEKYWGPQHRSA